METEEKGKLEGFETIKLADISKRGEELAKEGKFMFFADMTGQAATFFSY